MQRALALQEKQAMRLRQREAVVSGPKDDLVRLHCDRVFTVACTSPLIAVRAVTLLFTCAPNPPDAALELNPSPQQDIEWEGLIAAYRAHNGCASCSAATAVWWPMTYFTQLPQLCGGQGLLYSTAAAAGLWLASLHTACCQHQLLKAACPSLPSAACPATLPCLPTTMVKRPRASRRCRGALRCDWDVEQRVGLQLGFKVPGAECTAAWGTPALLRKLHTTNCCLGSVLCVDSDCIAASVLCPHAHAMHPLNGSRVLLPFWLPSAVASQA